MNDHTPGSDARPVPPPPTPAPPPAPAASPGGGDPIPLAQPAGAPASPPPAAPAPAVDFGPRPIFELQGDRCPRCGDALPADALLCVKCGYDQRANVVHEVQTGVVDTPPPAPKTAPPADKSDFVQPGRLSPKILTVVGGLFTIAAMVSTGVFGPHHSFWIVVGNVLLTLYLILVNTATGAAAVAVAARVSAQPMGRLDHALARMFAAFALFQAAVNTRPNLGLQFFTATVPFLVAAALYFGAIMFLFRKDRRTATLIAATHFILWILLQLGPTLASWVTAESAAVRPPV